MMKSTLRFGAAVTALALAASAGRAGPFTPGNLVVTQIGDGSAALTAASTAIFLVEINPNTGAVVQTIPLPIAVSGSNRALTVRGSSTSAGHLARSVDDRYLTMTGYDAPPGVNPIQSTLSENVNRVIARIDAAGSIDTTTALSDSYSGDDIRLAVTTTGTDFWTAGTGGSGLQATAGVRYTTLGSTTAVQLASTPTNIRIVGIFNNQLYMTSATGGYQGISAVGTGLPTTSGQTITALPGFPIVTGPSNYDFFFADANTVYVADDTSNSTAVGGIQKWTFDTQTNSWTKAYTLTSGLAAANSGCRGLSGQVTRAGVVLYATECTTGSASTGNRIITVTDAGPTSGFTAVGSAAPANTTYRGIAFAPVGGTPPSCYANCDASTNAPCLNVNDFTCFLNSYSAGGSYANCDASTISPVLNVNDFTCFLNKYSAGCTNPCAAP